MEKIKPNIIVYHHRNGIVPGCVDGRCYCGVFGAYWVGAQHSQHAIGHVHSDDLNDQQILDNSENLKVILALKLKT